MILYHEFLKEHDIWIPKGVGILLKNGSVGGSHNGGRPDTACCSKGEEVLLLWIGTAERISAIDEMKNPGVWVIGELSEDDRGNGMSIVVEYADKSGKPKWVKPESYQLDYTIFGNDSPSEHPDEIIKAFFEKHSGAWDGFNKWTINGAAFDVKKCPQGFTLKKESGIGCKCEMPQMTFILFTSTGPVLKSRK